MGRVDEVVERRQGQFRDTLKPHVRLSWEYIQRLRVKLQVTWEAVLTTFQRRILLKQGVQLGLHLSHHFGNLDVSLGYSIELLVYSCVLGFDTIRTPSL